MWLLFSVIWHLYRVYLTCIWRVCFVELYEIQRKMQIGVNFHLKNDRYYYCFLSLLHQNKNKTTPQHEKTARAMTDVSNLFVSLRRKTDGSLHSVAQTYWIKKDVSPSVMVPGNRQYFKYTKKQQDERPWFSTDCSFCWCTGYLAVPQDDGSDGSCFLFRPSSNHIIQ